jgi:predicted RNase H-like nuclease (RuvC/YqgF family)
VLLPEQQGNVTDNHHRDGQGDRNPNEEGYVTPDVLKLHNELAEARITIARLEERLAATADIRAAIEAKAQGAVDAATLAAKAEVEAMRQQLETEVAARNAVIEELKAGLDHERARSERLEGLLAEARRPWWRRWLS